MSALAVSVSADSAPSQAQTPAAGLSLGEGVAQALQHVLGGVEAGPWEGEGELLAAVAGEDVAGPQRLDPGARHLL